MILHLDVDRWPDEWREAYEERAAIMEYVGNLSRADAERLAEEVVRLDAEEL